MKNKTIKFAPNLIPLIISGEKTITYRYGDKYASLMNDDVLDVLDSSDNKIKCQIRIFSNETSTFGELKHAAQGHEKYESKESMRQLFATYYGKQISDQEKILVIKFELI